MSITVIEKSQGRRIPNSKVALVLAGGAVSGGAFKLGGLKALNDYFVNRKMTDFDLFVGLSAGSLLSAAMANKVSPEEMLKSLDGNSESFSQLKPWDFYWPNIREFITRPLWVTADLLTFSPVATMVLAASRKETRVRLREMGQETLRNPNYHNVESFVAELGAIVSEHVAIPNPLQALIPSGFFDNQRLEQYLRGNIERAQGHNRFDLLKKHTGTELYICATQLDTADRAVFGHDEINDYRISEAVQASTAIPGFYRPVRLGDTDYVDGAVRKTANIDVAIEKGADLIIAYNPFRPLVPADDGKRRRKIRDEGLGSIINQVFRTMLHTRLQLGMERYANDPSFQGDIILIEPEATDEEFFNTNPLAFWKRSESARLGYESVINTVEERFDQLRPILRRHSIELSRHYIQASIAKLKRTQPSRPTNVMEVLNETNPIHNLRVAGDA